MQRLRHPIRSIREPFGKAGLTVAICALVMAMVGGAYAASGLNGKQKKEVEKIAKNGDSVATASAKAKKGPRGKPGKTGPAGPAGAKGDTGTNGKDGTNGTNGKEGPEGKDGKEGSPWTAGGTLPSGKTETGNGPRFGSVKGATLRALLVSGRPAWM